MERNLTIVQLTKDNKLAWLLMPQAIERIRKFCIEFSTDTDPDFIEHAIHLNFVSEDPKVGVWVGVDSKGKVLGHLVATVDEVGRLPGSPPKRVLTILQFEVETYLERDLLKAGFKLVCEWGKARYCDEVQLLTTDEKRERLFMKYGFRKHRILMRGKL